MLQVPVTPLSKTDPRRIDWPACMEDEDSGQRWQSRFMGLAFECRCNWEPAVTHAVVRSVFGHYFPGTPYRPANMLAAIPMCVAHAANNSQIFGTLSEEAVARWLEFDYNTVTLTTQADRHRYENLGVLPGQPDPPDDPEEHIMPTTTKKTSKKTNKKTSKKTNKKAASKKTTKKATAKTPAERPSLPGVPQEYVSTTVDGELYDKRLGRPGTYKHVICGLAVRKNGVSQKEGADAAQKLGLYEKGEDERAAAEYQFKMHRNFLKRNAAGMGMVFKELDADSKRFALAIK
jgi:hypothetical protein